MAAAVNEEQISFNFCFQGFTRLTDCNLTILQLPNFY